MFSFKESVTHPSKQQCIYRYVHVYYFSSAEYRSKAQDQSDTLSTAVHRDLHQRRVFRSKYS